MDSIQEATKMQQIQPPLQLGVTAERRSDGASGGASDHPSWAHLKVQSSVHNTSKQPVRNPLHLIFVVDVSGSMGTRVESTDASGSKESHGFTILDLVKHSLLTILNSLAQFSRVGGDGDNLTPAAFKKLILEEVKKSSTLCDKIKFITKPVNTTATSQSDSASLTAHVSNQLPHIVSLIAFTDSSVVELDRLPLNSVKNLEKACEAVNNLRPLCSTNLWAGLKDGLETVKKFVLGDEEEDIAANNSQQQNATFTVHQLAESTSGSGLNSKEEDSQEGFRPLANLSELYQQEVMVFTDGCPNVEPPRGHIPSMQRFIQSAEIWQTEYNYRVNTFGFGYSLDSELLQKIASVGRGSFAFIPDASFVGTIFIHAVADMLVSAAGVGDVKLVLSKSKENAGGSVIKGFSTMITNLVGGDGKSDWNNKVVSPNTIIGMDAVKELGFLEKREAAPQSQKQKKRGAVDVVEIPLGSLQNGQSRDIMIKYPDFTQTGVLELRYNHAFIEAVGGDYTGNSAQQLILKKTKRVVKGRDVLHNNSSGGKNNRTTSASHEKLEAACEVVRSDVCDLLSAILKHSQGQRRGGYYGYHNQNGSNNESAEKKKLLLTAAQKAELIRAFIKQCSARVAALKSSTGGQGRGGSGNLPANTEAGKSLLLARTQSGDGADEGTADQATSEVGESFVNLSEIECCSTIMTGEPLAEPSESAADAAAQNMNPSGASECWFWGETASLAASLGKFAPAGGDSDVDAQFRQLMSDLNLVGEGAASDPENSNNPTTSGEDCDTVASTTDNHRMTSSLFEGIFEDLKGQVLEAADEKAWVKWGEFYLRSLSFAHMHQRRNNFKDFGVQHYGSELLEGEIDRVNEVFDNLPPPTPSGSRYSYGGYGGGCSKSAQVSSMSAYNNCYGGCFLPNCLVTLSDGSRRRCDMIRQGDIVQTGLTGSGSKSGVAKVLCVIKIVGSNMVCVKFNEGAKDSYEKCLKGLAITPWHPMLVDGEWKFPCEYAESSGMLADGRAEKVATPVVYNYVLSAVEGQILTSTGTSCDLAQHLTATTALKDHTMLINGVPCVTFGHGLETNSVVKHEYWGNMRPILRDLTVMDGWQAGRIELQSETACIKSPDTNLVVKMVQRNRAGAGEQRSKQQKQQQRGVTCSSNCAVDACEEGELTDGCKPRAGDVQVVTQDLLQRTFSAPGLVVPV